MSRKDMSQLLREIRETELRCGYNAVSEEKMAERFKAMLGAVRVMMEDRERGEACLGELVDAGVSTPEALAMVLDWCGLAETSVRRWVEEYLEATDYQGLLLFRGCLAGYYDRQIRDGRSMREHIRRAARGQQHRSRGEASPWFAGRGVVYTVITGSYDRLWEPQRIEPDWEYYCVTDNPSLRSEVWKLVLVDTGGNPLAVQRRAKILPWEYLGAQDHSIYVDGNVQITGDLKEWIAWYAGRASMLCFPHAVSDGLEDELRLIRNNRPGFYEAARRQVEAYHGEGYPDDRPMIQSNILLRAHGDPLLRRTMETWWGEMQKSTRDQISFGYSCWKNGFTYDLCELDAYDNPYVLVHNHGAA